MLHQLIPILEIKLLLFFTVVSRFEISINHKICLAYRNDVCVMSSGTAPSFFRFVHHKRKQVEPYLRLLI